MNKAILCLMLSYSAGRLMNDSLTLLSISHSQDPLTSPQDKYSKKLNPDLESGLLNFSIRFYAPVPLESDPKPQLSIILIHDHSNETKLSNITQETVLISLSHFFNSFFIIKQCLNQDIKNLVYIDDSFKYQITQDSEIQHQIINFLFNESGIEPYRSKRKLTVHLNDFYNVVNSYSGCVTCAIMSYNQYELLDENDYLSIYEELYIYYSQNFKCTPYEMFCSLSDSYKVVESLNFLLTRPNNTLQDVICEGSFRPGIINFLDYTVNLSSFSYYMTQIYNYNILCLMHESSKFQGTTSEFSLYVQVCTYNLMYIQYKFNMKLFGGTPINLMLSSNTQSNGATIQLINKVLPDISASGFNTSKCGFALNSLISDVKIIVKYIGAVSHIINRQFHDIGIAFPNGTFVISDSPSWIYCSNSFFTDTITTPLYMTGPYGVTFSKYSKVRPISFTSATVTQPFSLLYSELRLKCKDARCISCHLNTELCVECGYYSYLNETQCFNCKPDCQICPNGTYCELCRYGYGIIPENNTCARCPDYCIFCNQYDHCDECYFGSYGRISTGASCLPCTSANCLDCENNYTICSSCDKGYSLNAFDSCETCPENCLLCSRLTSCDLCDVGFGIDTNTSLCGSCSNHCLTCLTTDSCSKCESGFGFDADSGFCEFCRPHCELCTVSDTCDQCEAFYGFNSSSGFCEPCGVSCLNCLSPAFCDLCEAGLCSSQISSDCDIHMNCTVCSTDLACTECVDPNSLPDPQQGCSCVSNAFLASDGFCQLCPETCLKCNSTECTECISTAYLNSTGECILCHSSCLSCNSTFCFLCADPNSHHSSDAECECNDGFYNTTWPIDSNAACGECPIECTTCSTYSTCLSCKEDFLLINESCLYPKGLYQDYDQCLMCADQCDTCDQADACLTCKSSFAEPDVFGCRCIDGYGVNNYLIAPNFCSLCKEECLTCSAFDYCLSCKTLYAESYIGNCHCEHGYYNETEIILTEFCLKCKDICFECINNYSCLSCISNNAKYINDDCICDEGYHNLTSLTDISSCIKCPSVCATCETHDYCNLCVANNTDNINGLCTCKKSFYNETDLINTDSCLKCPDSCEACTALNLCTECKAFNTTIVNGECVCIDGLYNAGDLIATNSCLVCPAVCSTCDAANNCLSCTALNTEVVNGECMCLQGFYNITQLSDGDSCLPCSEVCSACTDFDFCLTCKAENTNLVNGDCTCADRFYNSTGLIAIDSCKAYPGDCLTCDSLGYCLSCISDNTFISNGNCICQPGYFNTTELITHSSCLKCSSSCVTCTDINVCTECVALNAVINNGICECANGYFNETDLVNNNSCVECQIECETCNSPAGCLTCVSSYTELTNGVCTCLPGYYNTSNLIDINSCFKCSESCETCIDFDYCLTCTALNTEIIHGECLCNERFYNTTGLITSASCLPCSNDCQICSSYENCISCIAYNTDIFNGKCLCRDGFYNISELVGVDYCLNCHGTCKRCSAYSYCEDCVSLHSISVQGQCTCIDGYYNLTDLIGLDSCKTCPLECGTCDGPSNCLTCFAQNSILTSGSCSCLPRFYNTTELIEINSCLQCSPVCATCIDLSNCLTCTSLNTSIINGECVCLDGFYNTTDLISSGSCLPCPNDCSSCDSLTNCLTCVSLNTLILSGECYCENGYYNTTELVASDSCLKCSSLCSTCNLGDFCLTCKATNTLLVNGICSCDDGYYNLTELVETNSCIKCTDQCLACTDSKVCTVCTSINTDLVNGECICKNGYFNETQLTEVNSCLVCSQVCSTCSLFSYCLTCTALNTYILNGNCYCNSGFYNITDLLAIDSCLNCQPSCKTCNSANFCITCTAINAISINGICTCKANYYNTTDLIAIDSCISCISNCSTCDSSNICLTCADHNASPEIGMGCKCNIGYYLNTLNVCTECSPSCNDCIDGKTCESCKDPNSQLSPSKICECIPNYVPSSTIYCLLCSSDCLNCDANGNCLNCKDPNAHPVGATGCKCNYKYYLNSTLNSCTPCFDGCLNCTEVDVCVECAEKNTFGDSCESCHSSCATCDGPSKYDCLSCQNSSLISQVCIQSCPVGYKVTNGNCVFGKVNEPILKMEFKGEGQKFFDSINNFSAVAELPIKERKLAESYGIISTYQRGIYMRGESVLIIRFNDTYLLGSQFAVSIWLNPNKTSADILNKYSFEYPENIESNSSNETSLELTQVFNIRYKNLLVSAGILIGNFALTLTHTNKLNFQSWNHILVTVEYSGYSKLSLALNNQAIATQESIDIPFIDDPNSEVYIGGDIDYKNQFEGYLYLFEIYSTSTDFTNINTKILGTGCSGCSLCPASGSCIPECSITEYYDQSLKTCKSCPAQCSASCKNSESCSLCFDQYCVGCSTFEPVSCYECDPYYQAVNWLCEPCQDGTYYDSSTKTCKTCVGLCTSCDSSNNCFTCAENSELDTWSFCVCKPGYRLEDICIRNTFTAKSWIGGDNFLNLAFSEELMNELKSSDMNVFIDGSTVDFKIEVYDMANFIIQPNFDNLKKGSILKADLINVIVSKNYSLLVNTTFEGTLSISEEAAALKSLLIKAAAAKDMAKKGATAGVSVALNISFMNFDPTSFFDFLNTAEMFYSIYLFNLTINPILSEFLMGLRIIGSIPNAFSYIMDENEGVQLSEKFKKYQYPSNLALINLGVQFQSLFLFLFLGLVVILLSLIEKLKVKLKPIRKHFVYGIFLRFWIQTFFESLTAAAVGISFSNLENITQKFDYCFCVIIIIIEIGGTLFFLNLIRIRRKLVTQAEIEIFINKFGTFFEEFKENSSFYWMFYLFYLARRSILVICYQFVSDGILQLSTSIVFSLSIPLYVLFTRNFKQGIFNVYQFCNEILIAVYNTVILVSFIQGTAEESEDLSKICLQFITVAWAMNIGCSLFNTVKSIVDKVRKCLQKRRDRVSKVYKIDKYVADSEVNGKTQTISFD